MHLCVCVYACVFVFVCRRAHVQDCVCAAMGADMRADCCIIFGRAVPLEGLIEGSSHSLPPLSQALGAGPEAATQAHGLQQRQQQQQHTAHAEPGPVSGPAPAPSSHSTELCTVGCAG